MLYRSIVFYYFCLLGECTFEDPRLCGWENIAGDNFDWKRDNAGTSSSGTGPRFDHTHGTVQGKSLSSEYFLSILNENTRKVKIF